MGLWARSKSTYSYCSGWAGCEPCRDWRGCGNGRFEGPRARGEAHDLSFQDDWDETKEGERPRASPWGEIQFRWGDEGRGLEGFWLSEVRGEESARAVKLWKVKKSTSPSTCRGRLTSTRIIIEEDKEEEGKKRILLIHRMTVYLLISVGAGNGCADDDDGLFSSRKSFSTASRWSSTTTTAQQAHLHCSSDVPGNNNYYYYYDYYHNRNKSRLPGCLHSAKSARISPKSLIP